MIHLPDKIPFAQLSEKARATVRDVAMPHSAGVPLDRLATVLKRSRRELSRDLEDLSAEMLAITGATGVPALTDDEYTALEEHIKDHGVLYPILVDKKTGDIIDGRARVRAAGKHGKPCPREEIETSGPDARRALSIALNLCRRHVSQADRRQVVDAELRRDPSRSDRAIASLCGVSPSTVGSCRRELQRAGEVSNLDTRTDRKGVERPAGHPAWRPSEEPDPDDDQGRTVRIVVEARPDEYNAWARAAQGAPVSDWLRTIANTVVEVQAARRHTLEEAPA